MPMNTIAKDLRKVIGSANVTAEPEDLMAYEADATAYLAKGTPDVVVLPTTDEEVSKVVGYADAYGIPLTPRGAGSGVSGGCTPIRGGIVMDMKRMNRILSINRGNLTAQVESGVVLADIHRSTAKQKLFYPPDPQSMSVCTIGGNIATRAGGPHGVKYGTTANYVLSLKVVLPDGSIITTGSACVKHSVGYDLTHLFTGSEGTLGVITQATLRLLPLPPAEKSIIISCGTVTQAVDLVTEIIAAGIVPAMLEYVNRPSFQMMCPLIRTPFDFDGEAVLLLKLDGSETQIAAEKDQLEEVCRGMDHLQIQVVEDDAAAADLWRARSKLYPLALKRMKRLISEDVTVPRDRIAEFAAALKEISAKTGARVGFSGHAGDGNLHPSIALMETTADQEALAQRAAGEIIKSGLSLGGNISGEHGIGLAKSQFIEAELGRRQVNLMKHIKNAVDPNGIMNPGKIWPWES